MNFAETIRFKALAVKSTLSGQSGSDLFDLIQEHDGLPSTRNICAIIHVKLFERVENITTLLNISKRQFVEHALLLAVEKADIIIKEVNPMEYVDEEAK